MIVKIKHIGLLAGIVGEDIKTVEAPDGMTVEEIIDAAFKENDFDDAVRRILKSADYQVNSLKAEKETVLKDGDEVAIIKTLGGG